MVFRLAENGQIKISSKVLHFENFKKIVFNEKATNGIYETNSRAKL